MTTVSTTPLSGYSILTSGLNEINFENKCIINTINQNAYIVAEYDNEFKIALSGSDILLPDGVSIVAAVRFLNGRLIKKISGDELHHFLLKRLNRNHGSCFYLGSRVDTLNLIKDRINKELPGIRVSSYSPPFKQIFTEDDNKKIIRAINKFAPDVLFVGMTAPKQEKWVHRYQSLLNANTICSIGAAFDFYAGTVKRPSKFWQNLWLEWFIRLVKEPRRMFKRYLYNGPLFVFDILKQKLNI